MEECSLAAGEQGGTSDLPINNLNGGPETSRRTIRGVAEIEEIERLDYSQAVPVRSTHALLSRSAELYGDHKALIYLPNGRADDEAETWTYRQLLSSVNRTANALRALGVTREDAVALLLPSSPETVVAFFAAQAIGRVCPINYMLSADHIAELIEHSGAKVAVVLGPDPAFPIWEKIPRIRALAPRLEQVLTVGEAAEGAPKLGDLALAQSAEPAFDADIDPDAIASFFHTGGSTGVPKLVRHTHRNEVHVAWFAGMFYDVGPQDVFVNGFPFFHVAGSIVLAGAAIAAGAATLIPSRLGMRNPDFVRDYWKIVEKYDVTVLSGGPTFVSTLVGTSNGDHDISRVKALFGGGSPMPGELAARFEKRFNIALRSIYGMTEAAGLVSLVPRHAQRVPGSSGWPLPFCEVQTFALGGDGRPDPTRPLARGEHGAIAIRGANVSPGYSNARLSQDAFMEGGWLATGDTGRIDPDGQIFVLGRSKDVIIRGGHNIDPLVIEEALMHHPDVELCAAVGEPNRYSGELPVAFLKLKTGRSASPQEVLDAVRQRIPEPAAVPKQLYVIEEMPLTTTGKVFKPALRREAVERALLREFRELLPPGLDIALACREELGQRKVTISLAQGEATEDARRLISEHMSMLSMPFDFATL